MGDDIETESHLQLAMTDRQRKFSDFLKSKGLKLISERQAVVNACAKLPNHFEVEDIYLKSRENSKRRIFLRQ